MEFAFDGLSAINFYALFYLDIARPITILRQNNFYNWIEYHASIFD